MGEDEISPEARANYERQGVEYIRRFLDTNAWPQADIYWANKWVVEKDQESAARKESAQALQAAAASRAADAAERQAAAAERANTKANIAMAIAIASIIANIVMGFWVMSRPVSVSPSTVHAASAASPAPS